MMYNINLRNVVFSTVLYIDVVEIALSDNVLLFVVSGVKDKKFIYLSIHVQQLITVIWKCYKLQPFKDF